MAGGVIPSDLEIPAVFSHAKCEYLVFNKFLFIHHIEDGSHVNVCGSSASHPQDAVCFLRIEQVRLFGNASKSEIKLVVTNMVVFSDMYLVFDKEASVCAALSICLKELAPATLPAVTVRILIAIVYILGLTHVELILIVQVARAAAVAVPAARKRRYATACVHDERLLLLL